jgi:hypothetical protein
VLPQGPLRHRHRNNGAALSTCCAPDSSNMDLSTSCTVGALHKEHAWHVQK